MLEKDIIKCARHYTLFKDAISNGKSEVVIKGYRRKEIVKIDEQIKKLFLILDELNNELKDEQYIKIFNLYFIKKYKEFRIISELNVSLSTYHRYLKEIKETLIALCAYEHLVERVSILKRLNKE